MAFLLLLRNYSMYTPPSDAIAPIIASRDDKAPSTPSLLFALHPLTSAAMRSNAKTASLAAQALARAAAGARAPVLHPPAVAVRGQLTLVVKAFVISVFEASGNRLAARTQVLATGLRDPK